MGSLADLQMQFRKSIQTGSVSDSLKNKIVSDAFPASARMQVYQNNYRMTLVDVLQGIFPLVTAFVGEEFLRGAAGHFLEENPPCDPQLYAYGAEFPNFLASYQHAQEVIYVADLAALEWAIHELQHVKSLLEGEGAEQTNSGMLVNPNIRVIESDYPLLQLWMVGTGQLVPEAVHIGAGGQAVAVVLEGFEVKLQALNENELNALRLLEEKSPEEEVTESLVSKNIIIKG